MSEKKSSARTLVWDLPLRVFHWTLAASFAAAYALSESERLRNVHVMLGYSVAGLIVFRLAWGFLGTHYARFRSFAFGPAAAIAYLRAVTTGQAGRYVGHNPAGSWSVYAILTLALATGVTGYLNLQEIGGNRVEELHELLANAWLAVVALHVAGVVFSSVVHRENLIAAMLTGYKRGAAAVSGRPRWAVGVSLATAVLAFWTWTLATGGPVSGMADPVATAAANPAASDDDDATGGGEERN